MIPNNQEERNDIDQIIGDFNYHQDPALTSHDFINLLLEDGTIIQRHFCIKCQKSILKNDLRKMYDKNNDCIDILEVHNDTEYLPTISLHECDNKSEGTFFRLKSVYNLLSQFRVIVVIFFYI